MVIPLPRPNFSPHALPRVKTGAGAAADEMATDPSGEGHPPWPLRYLLRNALTPSTTSTAIAAQIAP